MTPTVHPKTKPAKPHPAKPSKGAGVLAEAIGTLTGDATLRAAGEVERAAADKAAVDAASTERMKGAMEEVVGGLQKRIGHLVQNETMEVDGRAKELHGRARQKDNL